MKTAVTPVLFLMLLVLLGILLREVSRQPNGVTTQGETAGRTLDDSNSNSPQWPAEAALMKSIEAQHLGEMEIEENVAFLLTPGILIQQSIEGKEIVYPEN